MPTYSEPTFRVALLRACPACKVPKGEHCTFGPHDNPRNPATAAHEARALPRDLDAEVGAARALVEEAEKAVAYARQSLAGEERRLTLAVIQLRAAIVRRDEVAA